MDEWFLDEYFNELNTELEDYDHPIFAELDNMLYIGNLLFHENKEHYDLQMNEIKRFRDAVYAFEDAFKCRKHNKFLKFDEKKESGNMFATKLPRYSCLEENIRVII